MFRFALPAAALILAGAGASAPAGQRANPDQALIDKALRDFTAGAKVDCVRHEDVSEIRTFEDTILYERGRNTIWRNNTQGCKLGRDDLLVSKTLTPSRYCAGDIVQTHARMGGQMTGSCTLGPFVTYTRTAQK